MMRTFARFVRELPHRYGRVTGSGTYVPQIDGLRFLAIVLVMLYHAAYRGERAVVPVELLHEGPYAYLPNGVAGVELFFFISGYIIAFPFLSGRTPTLRDFYLRRVYRLEPPYFLMLILCFLVLLVGEAHLGTAPQFRKSDVPLGSSFLASCFYLHGLLFQASPRLNPPLWSLELEIQFYLLAPLILAAYKRIGARSRRVAVGSALCLLVLAGQVTISRYVPIYRYIIFGNCYAFILGIVLCDLAVAHNPFQAPSSRRYDLLFGAGCILFLAASSLWIPWRGVIATDLADALLLAASIVMMYFGAARGTASRRLLALPWVTLIGGACYSLYLVHIPVMQTSGNILFKLTRPENVIVAMLLSLLLLVPALVTGLGYYLAIERPCMQRDWPTRLWARLRQGRALPLNEAPPALAVESLDASKTQAMRGPVQ